MFKCVYWVILINFNSNSIKLLSLLILLRNNLYGLYLFKAIMQYIIGSIILKLVLHIIYLRYKYKVKSHSIWPLKVGSKDLCQRWTFTAPDNGVRWNEIDFFTFSSQLSGSIYSTLLIFVLYKFFKTLLKKVLSSKNLLQMF